MGWKPTAGGFESSIQHNKSSSQDKNIGTMMLADFTYIQQLGSLFVHILVLSGSWNSNSGDSSS